jgi:hypothetical protein
MQSFGPIVFFIRDFSYIKTESYESQQFEIEKIYGAYN